MNARRVANLWLALNLTYCVLGLFVPHLPAWRMFERAERLEYDFLDRQGATIPVANFLPGDAVVLTLENLLPVLSFICRQRPEHGPYRLIVRQPRPQTLELNHACDPH